MRPEWNRIGVVGAGLMGSGISEVCARAGADVLLYEPGQEQLDGARARIDRSLSTGVDAGKLSSDERSSTLERLCLTTDLDRLADRQLVPEAVPEQEQLETALFRRLDQVLVDPNAVLATNTSSAPIARLAMATNRPKQVLGLHFFNPVPVLALVEVIPSLLTAADVLERSERFLVEVLHKQVIRSADRAGFVVNALLVPYLLAAIRMADAGTVSVEEIDLGMVEGCAHPMGPQRLCDLIGLDTVHAIAESLYQEFKEPLYAPAPSLSRLVDAGLLGRKSGRGFYTYA